MLSDGYEHPFTTQCQIKNIVKADLPESEQNVVRAVMIAELRVEYRGWKNPKNFELCEICPFGCQ
jgi:hypothetical protein